MAYPKTIQPTLPTLVIGADAETKSLRPDAYLLTTGLVAFDVPTLKMVGSSYMRIDPNDPKAKAVFHEDPQTVGWWEGKGEPEYAPSREAYTEAWGGTTPMPEALWAMRKWLDEITGKHNFVITMRGPDFDSPIFMNAFAQCDVPPGKFRKFSALDSDRTAERLALAFGFEPDLTVEQVYWTRGKPAFEHHALWDAAKEAYTTARIYHLALITREYGYERAKACHEELKTGEYIPPQIRDQLTRD